jgi:hypothetical protein
VRRFALATAHDAGAGPQPKRSASLKFPAKLTVIRRALLEALGGLIGEDLAIANMNHAMRKLCDIGLVRHQDDGVAAGMKGIEQRLEG